MLLNVKVKVNRKGANDIYCACTFLKKLFRVEEKKKIFNEKG